MTLLPYEFGNLGYAKRRRRRRAHTRLSTRIGTN